MPEGPEVRHSRDVLASLLVGRWITSFELSETSRYGSTRPNGYDSFKGSLPARIVSIDTKGKFMWWTLETRDGTSWYMWCTYGMTAQWSIARTQHAAASITAYDASNCSTQVHFNDPRHFGTLRFVKDRDAHDRKLASLGPCILADRLSPGIFRENALKKPERTISEILMDQSVVSGCGNYLKAETLYRAGISPWRRASDMSDDDASAIVRHLAAVAQEAYEAKGATLSTYRTPTGETGRAQFSLRVYSKRSCPAGHDVTHETTPDGRTSWWCPTCQC